MVDEKITFKFPSGREFEIMRPSLAIKSPLIYSRSTDPPARKPSVIRQAWSYARAIGKWKIAGSPVRSQKRIDEILSICQACPMFAMSGKRPHCKVCGCSMNSAPDGLNNKIAMATEKCPLNPPKWGADV